MHLLDLSTRKSLAATAMLFSLLLAMLYSSSFIGIVSATVPNQYTLTVGTIGEPETVDPQWLYDTASAELVTNVYDTLLSFYVNRSLPRADQGRADQFEANLAYEWYLDETTDPDRPVFYFRIRGTHDHFIAVMNMMPYMGGSPVSTIWEENGTSEQPGCQWSIWKWEDNGDGYLSPCDIVKMDKLDYIMEPEEPWLISPDMAPWLAFHVQEMIEVGEGYYMMLLKELPVPFQIYRTLTVPPGFNPTQPAGFTVTETTPVGGRQYIINEFEDGMFGIYNGAISKGDVIQMTRVGTPPVEYPESFTRDYVVESFDGEILVVKPCLTCWDIEYTFERWFVLDHSGGPQWMIYEVLAYPEYSWPDSNPDEEIYEPDLNFNATVDAAIETDCTWVWFTFAMPYASCIFKQVIAQSWASILYMDWAMDQGCWNGDWASVPTYHDPTTSPLDKPTPVMCGTGPYYFVEWIPGSHWKIERFEEHWQQWPCRECDGYVDVVIERFISEWPTRRLMFLAGDLDFCYVPTQYKSDVLSKPGIRCDFPLPGFTIGGNFFNLDISPSSRYLQAPFIEHLADGVIKETGIPADFFNDVNLRKAFAYCVSNAAFLAIAFPGFPGLEASYPVTPLPLGPAFGWARHDASWYLANQYDLNLTKAEYYFKLAWGGGPTNPGEDPSLVSFPGEVWKNNFTLPIIYCKGNEAQKEMAEGQIKVNVESFNNVPFNRSFHVNVYPVDWGSVFVPELHRGELPMFIMEWTPSFLDPHSMFYAFMQTNGALAKSQSYSDAYVDSLIEEGMMSTTQSIRRTIYQELEEIYIRDVPSVCTYQPLGRHWERTWVYGWYYNLLYPGGYFKHYWKDVPPGVVWMEPVDLSVKDTMDDVHALLIAAHTNPPLINDGKPVIKMVTGTMPGSKPVIAITVDWGRVDSNTAAPQLFFAVVGLFITSPKGEHVEDFNYPLVIFGAPPVFGALIFLLDLTTLSADDYTGNWTFSAYINVVDETVYDNTPANNTIIDSWGVVIGTGDAFPYDNLGIVDISDLAVVVSAIPSVPGDPNWNWYCDVFDDGLNIVDVSDQTVVVGLVPHVYTPLGPIWP